MYPLARSLMLWAMVACPALWPHAAQAGENMLSLEGWQFRLVWPQTGALSPDVIREQAVLPPQQSDIFCGEAVFFNGESFANLGTPTEGVLLVGLRGWGEDQNQSAVAVLTVQIDGRTITRRIHARPGETLWSVVAVLPAEGWGRAIASFEGALLSEDAGPHVLPQVRSSCNE